MIAAVPTLVGLGSVFLAGAAIGTRASGGAARNRIARIERRESTVLEAVRVLTAASRNSTSDVLTALDGILRVLEPAIDDVIILVPSVSDLVAIHAAGGRSEHFAGVRISRDRTETLPALAAASGHRVVVGPAARALMPTDRAAVAIPMLDEGGLAAVVYAASVRNDEFGDVESLVRAVSQAVSPFALAVEREADRASATYDGLTGLFTPRAFRTRLQEEIALASRARGSTVSLWFIDTDHFKAVNDTFGHATGDTVLHHMAALLREYTIPGIDVAARNGGDEFCAIVRDVQKTVAIERAQCLCDAVRAAPFAAGARITASIGVASYPYDATAANELLEAADAAMYHSKRTGRDRVSFAAGGSAFSVYRE
ncbi:MAG: GGDEF domain-containing protein [Candidatus Eremiobacteraeota bacterium]|nr:GGDEF domain-containing protein [Candidatus Eremiobacteraeota bacterium]